MTNRPVYASTYDSAGYTGRSASADGRCPICGASGECPDAVTVPMPCAPVDVAGESHDIGGPLRPYAVTVGGVPTVLRLNAADAATYYDAVALDS